VAAAYNQIIIHYRDESGKECQSFWSAVDQSEGPAADYVELAAKAQAITDCAVIAVQFQSTVLIEATPTDGPYNTVVDRCMILSNIPETSKPITLQFVGAVMYQPAIAQVANVQANGQALARAAEALELIAMQDIEVSVNHNAYMWSIRGKVRVG